jgi:hypothetical protein
MMLVKNGEIIYSIFLWDTVLVELRRNSSTDYKNIFVGLV